MSSLLIIGAIGATAIASRLISLDNAADKLSVDLDKIQWKGVRSGKVFVDIKVRATNPTATTLPVQDVDLALSLDGTRSFAKIKAGPDQLGNAGKIAANATTTLTIPISITILSLIITLGTSIVDRMKGGDLPKTVKVNGTIRVAGLATIYDESIPLTK